jgi:hypothetical protein
LVYADDVNILGGRVYTIKKSTEALVVASKEIGLEVNTDKSKYMFMSRGQTAGKRHNTNTYNSSFEREEEFKYLETKLNRSKFCSVINSEKIGVRECLLSFCAESFVLQFAT